MENPTTEKQGSQMPQTLTPSNSGRRRSSTDSTNSPEFEFWMVRNPSFPQPDLLSADELFVNGVLLPLHLLHLHPNHPSSHDPPDDSQLTTQSTDPVSKSDPGPGPELSNATPGPLTTTLGASKRWKDMFKKGDRKNEDKEREKKKERKATGGGGGASSAELNIYLWPFSRSRSAGNGGNRPKTTVTRKVSSAPCSRSNSAGDSKFRSSPSRGRVHLGRSSPVWKARRGGYGGKSSDPVVIRSQKEGSETGRKKTATVSGGGGAAVGGGTKGRTLNLNVPMCVGYRQHLRCGSEGSSAFNVPAVGGRCGGESGGSGSGDGGRGGNLFGLRSLFTKRAHLSPSYG